MDRNVVRREVVSSLCGASLLQELVRVLRGSDGWGCFIRGPADSLKSEVARFLCELSQHEFGARAKFIDASDAALATHEALKCAIEKVCSEERPRLLVIDHLDKLSFPSGGTGWLERLTTSEGLIVIVTSRSSVTDIDPGGSADGIGTFRPFLMRGCGWVPPTIGKQLVDPQGLDREIQSFVDCHLYHWKALTLLAQGDSKAAKRAVEAGRTALIARLRRQQGAGPALTHEDQDQLASWGVIERGQAPPQGFSVWLQEELQKWHYARHPSVFDHPIFDVEGDNAQFPGQECDLASHVIHDWDEFRKCDAVTGPVRLQTVQAQVRQHKDACSKCQSVLNSQEVSPLVDDLLHAQWSPAAGPRLECLAWSIKYWVRGLRESRAPVPFLQSVIEHYQSKAEWAPPLYWSRVPEEDVHFSWEVLAPLNLVVRLVQRLRDPKHKPYASQTVQCAVKRDPDPRRRFFTVELHGGPPGLLPLAEDGGTTHQALADLVRWVGGGPSDRYLRISQEYKGSVRTVSLEFSMKPTGMI